MTGRRSIDAVDTLASLALAATILAGCSSSPCSPDSIVRDLYIGGDYYFHTTGRPASLHDGAYLVVREGDHTGPSVAFLSVSINGQLLDYDEASGYYEGVVADLACGDTMAFSIGDGLGTVSQSIRVPSPPTELTLAGGAWDVSGPGAINRLDWDNPPVLGSHVSVHIYDIDGEEATLIHSVKSDDPVVGDYTLPNSSLVYYEGISTIGVIVAQEHYAPFDENPGRSAIGVQACVSGSWPCVGGGGRVKRTLTRGDGG